MGSYAVLVVEADRHTQLKPGLAVINQNTTTPPKYVCFGSFRLLGLFKHYNISGKALTGSVYLIFLFFFFDLSTRL